VCSKALIIDFLLRLASSTAKSHYSSGFQFFSDHVPFVGAVLTPRTTLFQGNSFN